MRCASQASTWSAQYAFRPAEICTGSGKRPWRRSRQSVIGDSVVMVAVSRGE